MAWEPDARARLEALPAEPYRDVTKLAGGRFIPASRSGHFIPWQEPGLIAEAILQTVQTIRGTDA